MALRVTRPPGRGAGLRDSPHAWLAAVLSATVLLAGLAMALPPDPTWLPLLLGTLASVPVPAWLVGLRRWTPLAQRWPLGSWITAVVAAHVAAGLVYTAARFALTGGVGAWTVPLLWPTLLVADAGCALALWPCPFP